MSTNKAKVLKHRPGAYSKPGKGRSGHPVVRIIHNNAIIATGRSAGHAWALAARSAS